MNIAHKFASQIQKPEKSGTGTSFDYRKAFSRNLGLISESEQEKLRNATIAIPGMGGVGGIHLVTLLRMGIGRFHIADADHFEIANFNRQYGATMSTCGKNKVEVMARVAKDINPDVHLKTWTSFVTEENVDEFLEGCDIVMDSLDAYAVEARRLVYRKAREKGIAIINAGPIGFSVSMLIFTPESMSFDDYFHIHDGLSDRDMFARFVIGVAPKPLYLKYYDTQYENKEQQHAPCVASAMSVCAGFAATQALKIILKRGRLFPVPHYHYYDPYLFAFKRGYIFGGNRNPIQRLKCFIVRKYILK